ncbi:MAG TPA: alpha/beta hydrolase-fold protein [Ferruginibacter sp.]|nr:alpha/beta hydrolase-fold protein [Ferruginibacter sp.]
MLNKNITKSLHLLHLRKRVWLCFFLIVSLQLSAQYKLTIKIQTVPSSFINEPVFAAGSFNGWNPVLQQFSRENNMLVTEIKDVMAGRHEFKFTRGSWKNVECDARGRDIPNRVLDIKNDTTLLCTIEGWKDDTSFAASLHTASKNVQLAEAAFELPRLKKFRHIWVYLPPGYDKNKKHYPVMYIHDGQNVFDEYFAPFGEWGVDECLDSLIAAGQPGCIVVAIENGQMDRMSEYNPYQFTWKTEKDSFAFEPKADDYLLDIIDNLKPFIDKKYRTSSSKENTIITGSSMGGLISYYAAVKYPAVFGKAGIFSPAFWTASGIDSLTDTSGRQLSGKYFFYMGGKEGGTYVDDMKRICDKVGKNSSASIYSVIDPEAEHKEKYWRQWFAEFYKWIMADGYNVKTGN